MKKIWIVTEREFLMAVSQRGYLLTLLAIPLLMVTADLRQRIATQLGPFATGEERWFDWLSQHLLSSGQTHETATLLREFLGRPVSPQALLVEIGRMQKKN